MEVLKSLEKLSLFPVIGLEIEFYLSNPELAKVISCKCTEKCSLFAQIEKEKGQNQFEIKTVPTSNIFSLITELSVIKKTVEEISQLNQAKVNFLAKPFLDKPGNALHVHVNLVDNSGFNLFEDKNYLLWVVSGLCSFIKPSMAVFAPNVKCYWRYQYPDKNTPTTISWGYDNRTTALRVISNRIEHRVPCAKSDIKSVINEILKGVLHGIKEKNKIPPIHGIASRNQADLLPMTFSEAKRHQNKN
ncbi:MAG: glutamine synthetase [Rickettsiaceae bacterium H1]|nr:glutamine synthetase [Rickettsiaceae bacterium H1]